MIQTLKSRYLQSPAEVDAWMASLDQKYQDMVVEVKEAVIAAAQSKVDPEPAHPEPAQSTE